MGVYMDETETRKRKKIEDGWEAIDASMGSMVT
jgi:ribosome-associated protein YbcJ (S4-like RNA binding protein)